MEKVVENDKKINFWKKIYYSIFKLDEYENMINEGLKKSIKYFFGLVSVIAIVSSIFFTYETNKSIKEFVSYINDNVPDFTIENNELNIEDGEATILDKNETENIIQGRIIINTNLSKDEVINEYTDLIREENCIIFLKDKVLYLLKGFEIQDLNDENKNNNYEYTYNEFLGRYNINTDESFSKELFINNIGGRPVTYYWVQYFIIYFVMSVITFSLCIIIIVASEIIVKKIFKDEVKSKKDMLSLAIYSFTLPMILQIAYWILRYYINVNTNIFQTLMILISYFYVIMYINKNKNKK